MPSPFPGMDPYLEGPLWEDFHSEFIVGIRAALMPCLRPRYVAVIEKRVYLEHATTEASPVMRPDVTIVKESAAPKPSSSATATAVGSAPISIPLPMPEEVEEPYIEIRLRGTQKVVTIIEVLSPANKHANSDGRREYLVKREAVLLSPVHLIEIDLLRGGERLPTAKPLPPGDYYIIVSRVQRRPIAEVWAFTLRHRLPQIWVPLAGKDPDVPLDLQEVFKTVYDRAGYDYALDYRQELIPPLGAEDAEWGTALLTAHKTNQ